MKRYNFFLSYFVIAYYHEHYNNRPFSIGHQHLDEFEISCTSDEIIDNIWTLIQMLNLFGAKKHNLNFSTMKSTWILFRLGFLFLFDRQRFWSKLNAFVCDRASIDKMSRSSRSILDLFTRSEFQKWLISHEAISKNDQFPKNVNFFVSHLSNRFLPCLAMFLQLLSISIVRIVFDEHLIMFRTGRRKKYRKNQFQRH